MKKTFKHFKKLKKRKKKGRSKIFDILESIKQLFVST